MNGAARFSRTISAPTRSLRILPLGRGMAALQGQVAPGEYEEIGRYHSLAAIRAAAVASLFRLAARRAGSRGTGERRRSTGGAIGWSVWRDQDGREWWRCRCEGAEYTLRPARCGWVLRFLPFAGGVEAVGYFPTRRWAAEAVALRHDSPRARQWFAGRY